MRGAPAGIGGTVQPVTIGVDVSTSAAAGTDPVGDAQAAERLGFDFVSCSDHPSGTHPSFETWTLLTWMAAATKRVGIVTRVLGVPYRPPAMVAKMAETLNRLSGGRLILGLGGGYSDAEFRGFGLRVPTPREKVDGVEEAVQIIRGLWSQPGFSFDGRLFTTVEAELEPKPDRTIPIWLGTFGDRALRVTGRLADGWIPSHGMAPPERAVVMRGRVRAAAEDVGRDPDDLTCAYNVEVRVGEPPPSPDSTAVWGSSPAVAEQLASFVELGFTTLNLKPVGPDRAEQLDLLAAEVLPLL
ncbi:MAG: LLM class flavin-dependent oxidoreductase, partial [Actinomycetota bacterium]|nr:LLM class flavin-dependent oxidoreductase [Actinomycetota bacterium]